MGCELCAIDSMRVDQVEKSIPQDGSKLCVEDVEETFYLHPALSECVVMNAADEIHGEGFIAFVALQAELTGRESELRDWVRYAVPDYTIPERIVILPVLPQEPPGTVDRSALLDLIRSLETGLDSISSLGLTLIRYDVDAAHGQSRR